MSQISTMKTTQMSDPKNHTGKGDGSLIALDLYSLNVNGLKNLAATNPNKLNCMHA